MKPPIAIFAVWALASIAFALQPESGAVFVRVVDVGPGLSCVIKIPGGHNIVYDARDSLN
jgi:beta-lactamase superfamily II metal-dependent hydrolase